MELTETLNADMDAFSVDAKNNSQKPKMHMNPFNIQQHKEEKERRQKKKARLIIRNISYKVKEDLLRKHLSQWGNVDELNILKRPDGKLVGCAFVQYSRINEATKAILKGNNQPFLGRPLQIDWAVGKNIYTSKQKFSNVENTVEKKLKVEGENVSIESENILKGDANSEVDNTTFENEEDSDGDMLTDEEGEKVKRIKLNHEKVISNDVQNGCTVFIKNVPFDAEEKDLRKVFRKFGSLCYAIINREPISAHSKGTAFVKFKTKESADLCLHAGGELSLMDQLLEPYPALSRDEVRKNCITKMGKEDGRDSRNLYLAREGLIMANSKAAEGVSASDMAKRHKLEQIKIQVLKNLNRFVSRNRLSIHNLPLNYDNEKLKQMLVTYTGFKPHECRVMRENKISAAHPKGKSKGFGFMSFNTHQEALTALRKLNNHPSIFGTQHRPIVAFSIEDRSVQKIKENRKQRSKLNNPTFQQKMERRKEIRKLKKQGKLPNIQNDNKKKLKQHIEKLAQLRAAKSSDVIKENAKDDFVGTEAKPGSNIHMRSNKKIAEQALEHRKHVKANKRKEKAKRIRQIYLAERRAVDRPKQSRKEERDDLERLVNKYKRMIDGKSNIRATDDIQHRTELKAAKRTKWYTE